MNQNLPNQNLANPNLNTSWEELRSLATQQAQEIKKLQEQLEAKACQCHIIDPAKIRILLWINRTKAGKPETATLKIGEQRLLGLPRSDRRGEGYFRFDEIMEKAEENQEIKCHQCQKEAKLNLIKCWECQKEMKIFGELDEQKPLVCKECEKKKAEAKKAETQKEPKTKREEFKEEIAQAVQENQTQENHGTASSQN